MELKPGYKQTEVGVIPEDWEVTTVGNEFSIQLGKMLDSDKNIGVPKFYLGNRAVQWGRVEVTDIGVMKMTPTDLQRFRLRSGDLLVCEGGDVGRAAIWRQPIEECYYQKALHRLRPKRGYNPELLLNVLQRLSSSGFLLNFVTQTSIAHLPKDKFETVPIPLPSTTAEQRAIAAALSDADAFAESLEQLLAKKRLLKQGAMRELLTGERRLPEFATTLGYKQTDTGVIPEDWDVKPLSVFISSLDTGVSVNSIEGERTGAANDLWILKTSCVVDGKFIPDERKAVAPQDARRARLNPRKDSIIISRMNTPALVGECGYVDQDWPGLFLPDRLWMTRHDRLFPHSVQWLAHLLSFTVYRRVIKEAATGTSGSMKNISKESLLALRIPLPIVDEQEAIAAILSDMDAEIAALEAKLAKARNLKQGMMQELLTGRIRLVRPASDAVPPAVLVGA